MIVVERAISLTEPWAMLVALREKQYETRSWRTSYRGWIAIHASKRFPKECRDLCLEEPFKSALKSYSTVADLPLGQIIAIAMLTDCKPTGYYSAGVTGTELEFGDYSPGRFAWKLENVRMVPPKAAKGALGIWRIPPDLQWVLP